MAVPDVTPDVSSDVLVLRFGGRRVPRPLARLPAMSVAGPPDMDDVAGARRLIVLGTHGDLAMVLSRLLRVDRLDVEVALVRHRLWARRARTAAARRVPLIRDETGAVLTRAALWLPPDGTARTVTGEAVVDDTVLFDGAVAGVRIEPTSELPGLRARVLGSRLGPRRWVTGRAAQLGTTGTLVVRDGVAAARPARRSTFYRNTQGWLSVF